MEKTIAPQFTHRVNPVLYSHDFILGFFAKASPSRYAFYYRPGHGLPVQFDKVRGNIYTSAGLVVGAGQTAIIELCRYGGENNSDWKIIIVE